MINDKAERLSVNYKTSAMLNAAVEYYTFYEMMNEAPVPAHADIDDEAGLIRECFKKLAENTDITDMIESIENARKVNIEKMQVLTAYVDRLLVFERLMDRIAMRYVITEQEVDDLAGRIDVDMFVSRAMEYIFEIKDSFTVKERVNEIMGLLPVRMARSKFFSLIKESIKLYSESDTKSLDSYLYMIRTSAMIYETDGMEKYFTEFKEVLEELGNADYVGMEEDYYKILFGKMNQAVSEIQDISDWYMSLQQMLNSLYVYALNTESGVYDDKVSDTFVDIITSVNRALDEGYEPDGDEMFHSMEGVMEKLYDERVILEAMLGKEIPEDDRMYDTLKKSELLMSYGLFVDLNENFDTEPVTPEYIGKVTDELLADLQEMIKKNSRPVVRTVYSIILADMPSFFNNLGELTEYIYHSIEQCGDKVELVTFFTRLNSIISDEDEPG